MGTFTRNVTGGTQRATIAVKFGRLRVKTLALELAENAPAATAKVVVQGQPAPATVARDGTRAVVTLQNEVVVKENESLEVTIA